ncbi:MAG: DUF2306 domain-containing protein [Longimicrobiales bacterium]
MSAAEERAWQRRPRFPGRPFKWLLLAVLAGLGLWYANDAVGYAFVRDRPAEETWLRRAGSFIHLAAAVPLLLIAPLQFSRRLRARWPRWHRRIGRAYLGSAMVAALVAAYLGATFERVGSRTPLVIFALLWFAFSAAAWLCARRGAFAVHERFVVRSYALALAFVLVRLLGEFQDRLFPFMPDQALRDATREWLSFVLPLLAVETCYSWWPSFRAARQRRSPIAPTTRPYQADSLPR